jgi:hypothetical protein
MKHQKFLRPLPKSTKYESYLFEFISADCTYILSKAVPRWDSTIYKELWHMQYDVQCLAPAAISGLATKAVFIADRNLFKRPVSVGPSWRPHGVADLTVHGQESVLSAKIPYEAAWGIALAIKTGAFKYLAAEGAPLKRGAAHMSSLAFKEVYEERDHSA